MPWRAIVMVGLALVVFYTVDTAAATWGPVYLDDVFDAPEDLVALATLPYLVASGVVRLAGDRLTEQVGAVRLVRAGAAIALVALTVVVAAPSWPVAVLGFTLLGCGVAVVAPLSFSPPRRWPAGTPTRRRGGPGSTPWWRASTSSTTPVRCSAPS